MAKIVSQPRAKGSLELRSKSRDGRSAIDRFRSQGCLKALFPNKPDRVEAILINTAGGLTGGDSLTFDITAGHSSYIALTTQAAERGYRAASGTAKVDTRLSVEAGARADWLPQELILFEGTALQRRLNIDLARDARLLMVEPVVFGRHAMGETLRNVRFSDKIYIDRDGVPLYRDALSFDGDLFDTMQQHSRGAGAMASLVFVAPEAEAHLEHLRKMMPEMGGVSLLQSDVLALRLLATDSFELRRALLPLLDRLSGDTLPTSWRL